MDQLPIRPGVLLAINFVLDLLLLWSAAKIAWVRSSWWRLSLASLVGAGLAVLPGLGLWGPWLTSGIGVLVLSVPLVLLVVWPSSWSQFATVWGGFWLGLALAGGLVWGLHERYGSLAASLSFILVGSGVGLSLAGLYLVWQGYRERREVTDGLYELQVQFGEQTIVLTGFVDSGNSLRTPVGRQPVAVVEIEALVSLVPSEVAAAVHEGWDALTVIPPGWRVRCQVLPYAVVGRPAAALLVVRPDGLAMRPSGGGPWVSVHGQLGLAAQPLDSGGRYQALLPGQMLSEAGRQPGWADGRRGGWPDVQAR
jgi:stage II sporulation protein GA (sporulation sigma-E factor processing peptidase)